MMKRHFLRGFLFVLILSLLTALLPFSSFAADNELVLTKIGHTSADTVTITAPTVRAVTLTIPFGYAGRTLDLSTGLIIDKSAAVGAVITSFPAGAAATIGEPGAPGPAVTMAVTYYKGTATTPYTTSYTISVVRGPMRSPVFAGTLTKTAAIVPSGNETRDITFTAGDFTNLYTAGDSGALSAVSLEGSNLSCGTLKYASGTYGAGTPVALKDLQNLYFDATAAGNVSYIVRAYAGADRENPVGAVVLNITIAAVSVPSITGSVSKSVAVGATVTFSAADFTGRSNLGGGTLTSVEITPASTNCGTWYNGSSTFTGRTSFSAAAIGNLKFKGKASGTAGFTWKIFNEAGTSSSGSGAVTVSTISADVSYGTVQGAPIPLSGADFYNACASTTGYALSYIYFPALPSASYGRLYYNYSSAAGSGAAVNSSTAYYYSGNPNISGITFVPAAGFSGTLNITYAGYNANNASFSGVIRITASAGAANITYTTAQNTPKALAAADFNNVCTGTTGYTLSYIYFPSLPAASYGRLYSGYSSAANPGSAVSASSALYYSGTPNISAVTFVPAAGFSGAIVIPYAGYSTNGTAFYGAVRIAVGSGGTVSYTTAYNTPKTFSAADFDSACAAATGYGLSYITISPPSAAYGALYYNYASAASPGTAITAAVSFNTDDTSGISRLTFVPAANFTGTAVISFTGYSTGGTVFDGRVSLTVAAPVRTITYDAATNNPIRFSADDFAAVCAAATGAALDDVRFTPPSASYGKLCYNYTSARNPGTAVSSGTSYFYDGVPAIDNITFIPATNFTGSISVSYRGWSTSGQTFTGAVVIRVSAQAGSAWFSDVGPTYAWAAQAIDYLYEKGIVNGTGGSLYYPGTNIRRGDFILMLYNTAHFSAKPSGNFSDVPKGSYYYDAIAAAKALGIAQGYDDSFSPTDPLTRQDAMALIYRTLTVTGKSIPAGSAADISGFSDRAKIARYALPAVEALVKAGIISGSGGKINPAGSLTRAEMAVILYKYDLMF